MPGLGGSIFTHNVDTFDYCFREAIGSLIDLCDEVVILDAESTDGTLEALRQIAAASAKVRLIEGARWDCAPKHERLAVLANQARSYLRTDWHFMLQADEVLHEDSFAAVRRLMTSQKHRTFAVRRFNLFGDFDHMVSLTSSKKPCSDMPVRLGHTGAPAMGDAESLRMDAVSWDHVDEVQIFHYGLVRRFEALLDKSIDMQSWFHGPGQADPRCVDMKATGHHDPFRLIDRAELAPIPVHHPRRMADWIAARAEEKKAWMR